MMLKPDANKTIAAIGYDRARKIADVFGVDLTEPTGDVTAGVEWHCGVEGKWWPMSAQLVYLTDLHGIRWTRREACWMRRCDGLKKACVRPRIR